MARETKSLTVSPNDEQSTIDLNECFGWELQSSQEVYSKDSHLESRSDGVYNVTSTTNYVKLVFSREKDDPRYLQYVNLESEFNSIHVPVYPEKTLTMVSGIIYTVVGIPLIPIAVGVAVMAFGIFKIVKGVKENKQYKKDID